MKPLLTLITALALSTLFALANHVETMEETVSKIVQEDESGTPDEILPTAEENSTQEAETTQQLLP